MSSETAIDLIEEEDLQDKTEIMDCPLIEGAFAAAVQATVCQKKETIIQELAQL